MDMKSAILEKIDSFGDVSFADLMHLEDTQGDLTMSWKTNCIMWSGVSKILDTALSELMKEKVIKAIYASSPLVYIIDGATLQIPIAKKVREYKKPHWLPTLFVRYNDQRY